MSESMIERVALAIRTADAKYGTYYAIDDADSMTLARAAIAAMREPTDGMFSVAPAKECPSYVHDLWRDMVDAALNEQVAG